MKVEVTEAAKEYIREVGKTVIIRYEKKGWCHSGFRYVPVIGFSDEKDNPEDYHKEKFQEIHILVSKKAKIDGEVITIDLAKLFKWKALTVEGLQVV